ncbi:hypothetical protein [Syntrophotalea acetylenivorans]|uniref:hypothetical protein n=1 Tax=Syntrophotalea acetylenivorans TaxID=1842532 RepID=UPI000A571513|nr:hypothetical protein [Syntrophotalea acetylenivorans]
MKTTGKFSANWTTVYRVLILAVFLLALARYGHAHLPEPSTRHAYPWTPATTPAVAGPGPSQPTETIFPPNTDLATGTVRAALPAPNQAAEQRNKPALPNRIKYRAGEDPEFARQNGWPVNGPEPLPGAILPHKRIIAFYGNPLSWRMGILGKASKKKMLSRLRREMHQWKAADPSRQVQPALHLIAVTAQPTSGKTGKYRMIMPDKVVKQVYAWAKEANALLFIDIQTGHDDIRELLPRFEWILKNPDVHLGIDPEFHLIKSGAVPGTKIGTLDAAEVNYVTRYLGELVQKHNLPPKILTLHRFTSKGITNADKIDLSPEIQIVMHMDGWGSPWLKRDTYKRYIVADPVQYAGFKLFLHNDTKKGDRLMTPEEVLRLNPKPLYIQYQ